jgi:hypothetical protein
MERLESSFHHKERILEASKEAQKSHVFKIIEFFVIACYEYRKPP